MTLTYFPMSKGCLFSGCTNAHSSRGLCRTHYWQQRAGKPLTRIRVVPPLAERFWCKVEKTDGCWLWKGATGRHGAGQFHLNGKHRTAYRVSWELANGPIPDGLEVCHQCDTPACVRPSHLFLGTHQDNMNDMYAKGRRMSGPELGARISAGRAVALAKKTTCVNGHPYTHASVTKRGRFCRICANQSNARYVARKRAAVAPDAP